MKKIFSGLLFGTIIVSLVAGKAGAQLTKANAHNDLVLTGERLNTDGLEDPNTAKASVKALKANEKALESFKKQFRNAADVKWTVSEETISAYMYHNDVQTRVIYDKKGNIIHTLLFYKEDQMPANVKASISQAYPEYDIIGVQEIQEDGNTFYVVHIEGKTGFKEISFYNGELGVYKEFTKSK